MKSGMKLAAMLALLGGLSMTGYEAMAAANGDGICQPEERAKFECANFTSTVNIEFLGSIPSKVCATAEGPVTSCTAYYYRYTGNLSNQVNVALPGRVTKTLNTAAELKCSQFFAAGAGDPKTGFGKNLASLGVCRAALNLTGSPSDVTPPLGANFVITADPSAFDKENPLDWQVRSMVYRYDGREDDSRCTTTSAVSLLGPFGKQPDVLESAATLTTPEGTSVSYSNVGGNITLTGGNARLVPQGGTKLCVVNVGGNQNVPYTDPTFKDNWTCETITYTTEQCDIKTELGDPCRMIGGTCIKY